MKTGILFFLMSFGILLGGVDPETIHRQKDFPLIHGLAEPMTGKVVYQSVDHVIKGAEPIIIRKNYYTDMPDDALDGGWCFFPDLRLYVLEYYDANLFPHKGPEGASIYLEDLNGRKHYFYYSDFGDSENIHSYQSIVNHKQTFYRNTMSDEISGRTNPRNMKLEIEWGKKATLFLGDGTRKEYSYEKADQTEDRLKTRFKYKLQKEIKPNKNVVLYQYGKFGRLEKIETRDPSSTKVYATATLEYIDTKHCKKNRDFILKGNGKVLGEYKFWRPDDKSQKFAHNTFYLSDCHESFRKSSLLSKKYGYDNGKQATGESREPLFQGNKFKKAIIERKTTRLPYLTSINEQGKLSLLGYYNVIDCIINNGERSYIKSSYDHRFSRIKSIFTIDPLNPIAKEKEVGVRSEKWINSRSKTKYTGLYRFEYVLEPSNKADKYKKVVQTKVKNIINDDLMIFSFENENKPEMFEHIFSNGFGGKNHYVENYFWEGMSTEKYIAISKVLYQDINNKNSSFFIEYDYGNDYRNNSTVGNIQQKKITGNLTGQSNNSETYQIDYTYTGGRYSFNLPKTKKETCKLSVDYTYKHEKPSRPTQVNLEVIADLLTSRITYDEVSKEIYKREYFEYNSDNILIKKITDNGKIHAEKFDPNHAGEICKITQIIPVNVNKARNLPEQVVEKYLENGEEHTLLVHKYRYNDLHEVEEEEVCDPDGESLYKLTYNYAENGLLLSKSDPIGRETFYEYDTKDGWIFHRLRSINDEALPYTEHYSYDIAGNPQKKTQKPKKGNNPARDFFSSHDVLGNKVSETDFRGNGSTFSYDGRGNQTRQTTSLDNDTLITKTKYDAFGNPILLIDVKGYQTKKKYNTYGSVTEIIYPDNSIETFRYTHNNLLETHVDQMGTKIVYKYDSSGNQTCKKVFDREENLISQEEKIYDGFALKQIIDAEGNQTEYFYDGAGRKIAEEFTDSKTAKTSRVEYAYDVYGNVCSKGIINGSNTLFSITEKDKVGRVLEEREEDTEGNVYSQVNYTYDYYNKKTATSYVDSKEILTKFTYDSFNRLTSTEYPENISYKISYSDKHPNEYGKKVLQEVYTDPLNIQTTNTYDNLGNLKSTEVHNASKTLLSKEEFYYDKNLNPTLQKSFVYANGEPVREVDLQRNYDKMNRVYKMIEAANTPDKKITSYNYYPNGQLQVLTKPDGTRLHWTYDALGFEASLKSEGGSSDEHISYEYQHTKLGALQSSTNLFTGRSTLRELDGSGKILSETLANGLTSSYEYDNAGRETRVILFDGSTIEKEYGPAYLRKVIRKDSNENIIHTHHYNSYDQSGNLLEESFGEDTVSYSFDPLGRIVSVYSPYFSQTITEYDLKGKIKSMQLQDELYAFEYDDLEQLISEKGRFTHDYLFDSHNNPLSKDGGEYEVNHLNQIKQTPDADYTFDDNGNTLAKASDKTVEFDYDALDRLIRVRKEGFVPVQYIYDSFHRRVIKNREDKDILYLYQNQNEVGEVEDNCLMTFRTLGLTGSAELGSAIFMELYEKHCIPLYDLSLNVAELISKDQESVESYRYNAFGQEEVKSQYRVFINPWRFSSKRTDAETGYVYFGRRYYDAELGRWTTKDPKGYEEGINLYTYGLNNPLTVHDLYGLEIDYAHPTFFENEVQPFRCYARAFCEFSAEALVRPMDMFHMGISPPDINGNYMEPLRPSEVLLSSYKTHLDKVLPYNKNNSTNVNMVASTKAALESILTAFSGGMSHAGKAYQYAYAYGTSVLNTGMVQGVLGPVVSAFSSVLHKAGVKEPSTEQKAIEKAEREFAKESNNWTKGSPFKNKTAEELDQMFFKKDFIKKGDTPLIGEGSYLHPKSGRKYQIDPISEGRYREPSHVDVGRSENYNGPLKKKRIIYKDG